MVVESDVDLVDEAGVLDAAGVVATSTWQLREPQNGGRSDQRDGVRCKVVGVEAFG